MRQIAKRWHLFFKNYIEEGIKDGSVTAKHAKPLSQLAVMLTNFWMVPSVFPCETEEEAWERLSMIKEITEIYDCFYRCIRRNHGKKTGGYSEKLADFTGDVKDLLSGFEVIKSYGMRRYVLSRFEKSNTRTINAKYSVDKTAAANDALSMLLAVFLQVVVIFLSAYFIMIGRVTPGVLLGMTQASGNLANPFLMILGSIPKLKSVKPIIKRLKDLSEHQEKSLSAKQPLH